MPVLELPAVWLDGVYDEAGLVSAQVWNRDPAPDESGVPSNWQIGLDVVDPTGIGIDLPETRVYINTVLAFDGADDPDAIQAGFDGLDSGYSAIADGWRIRLQPVAAWESETVVTVRVQSRRVGDPSTPTIALYTFTSEDLLPPVLESATAIAQHTVRLIYSEAVQILNPLGFVFEATTKPAVPLAPAGAVADGASVDVTVDIAMSPEAGYSVTVTGVADLAGNSDSANAEFLGHVSTRPTGRRFRVADMVTQTEVNSDPSGDLNYWLACLQDVLDLMFAELDRFPDIISLDRAPVPFLSLILADLGNPFSFELTEDRQRKLASILVDLYRQSGTAIGIENAIRFFVGVEATVVPYTAGTLVLGESELNVDWILGPSGRRELYSFTVEVQLALTSTQRAWIYEIAIFMKPAHTHLEFVGEGVAEPAKYPGIVEIVPPEFWVLDDSELDESTILET